MQRDAYRCFHCRNTSNWIGTGYNASCHSRRRVERKRFWGYVVEFWLFVISPLISRKNWGAFSYLFIFPGIYGVGKGALNKPAMVVLSHNPKDATETVAWVGKGIVYDTGGLSIKVSIVTQDLV